jgi:hypothetical protein
MDQRNSNRAIWKRVRLLGGLIVVPFAITLAAIVGSRLDDQALAVVAGVACGVSAAIPTSLLILAASHWRADKAARSSAQQALHPPVVVISPPGQPPHGYPDQPTLPTSLTGPIERHFTVVGGTYPDTRPPAAEDT